MSKENLQFKRVKVLSKFKWGTVALELSGVIIKRIYDGLQFLSKDSLYRHSLRLWLLLSQRSKMDNTGASWTFARRFP